MTGSESAIPLFHEGLLLLHSFEFEDAAEKFVAAQQIDSNFVMAYWGEAMSFDNGDYLLPDDWRGEVGETYEIIIDLEG